MTHSGGGQVGAGSQLHWVDFPPDEPLHVAWPSLQHGGWIPKTSIPREPGGSCTAFYGLVLEIA